MSKEGEGLITHITRATLSNRLTPSVFKLKAFLVKIKSVESSQNQREGHMALHPVWQPGSWMVTDGIYLIYPLAQRQKKL